MCDGNDNDAIDHCGAKPPGDQPNLNTPAAPSQSIDHAIPAYDRRRILVSLVSLLLLFAAFGSITYFAMRSVTITLRMPMYLFALPPLAACLWGASYRVNRWSFLRRAAAADNLLCLHCLYDLRATKTLICPECGKAFTGLGVQSAWRYLRLGV